MPSPPVLHNFDAKIAGKVGLNIDPQSGIDQVVWYVSTSAAGPWTELMFSYVRTGLDGLTYVFDADSTARYYQAKTHDSTGYSGPSNTAGPVPPSSGPPAPLTKLQELEDAVGTTLADGDQVAVYLQPASKVLTVSNGTLT